MLCEKVSCRILSSHSIAFVVIYYQLNNEYCNKFPTARFRGSFQFKAPILFFFFLLYSFTLLSSFVCPFISFTVNTYCFFHHSLLLGHLLQSFEAVEKNRMRNSLRFKMDRAKVYSLVHRTIDGNGVDSSRAGKRNTLFLLLFFTAILVKFYRILFSDPCECACVKNSNVYAWPLHYFVIWKSVAWFQLCRIDTLSALVCDAKRHQQPQHQRQQTSHVLKTIPPSTLSLNLSHEVC